MNRAGDRLLLRLVAALRDHDIPRVGWPTSVLPPRGVRASASERAAALTVRVIEGNAEATARLDLQTREVVVSATGRSEEKRSRLRRIALDFIADRNAFDRLTMALPPWTPTDFDVDDPKTWSEMQLMADVTDADWYPAEPEDRSPSGWAAFYETAHRFNDRFNDVDGEATTPRPTPPRGEQSSAGPATPGRSGSAGV